MNLEGSHILFQKTRKASFVVMMLADGNHKLWLQLSQWARLIPS